MRDHGDDAYSRARRDPAFLEAVRKAYAGRRDVLNALWWMSHPAEAAPDGTPSPIDQLRDLQHRVFSADGDSAGDPHAILAIRDLEAELSAEREAITAAVQAADAGRDGHYFPSRTPVETAVGSAIPDEPGFAWTAEETVLPSEGRTRNLLVILGIVAALAAGFVVGTQVSVGRHPGRRTTHRSNPLVTLALLETAAKRSRRSS
ncbi:MAG TPA: hypothetical protein DCP11_15845 [Microbacteriaceae bacterium]|nr:hypothetical protein [Microbacteriaceae bacterium]